MKTQNTSVLMLTLFRGLEGFTVCVVFFLCESPFDFPRSRCDHLFPHLRVHIERVTSAAALSQHLQQQVLTQQDRGAVELETLTAQGQTGTRRTDRW